MKTFRVNWRRASAYRLLFWLGPGAILCILFRESDAWQTALLWYGLSLSEFTAWRTDAPNPD